MYANLDRLLLLSFGFFLLFSAFGTAQGLAAKVLQQNGFKNLGFHSLSMLYLTFGVFSLFSSIIVTKCGMKTSLVLGSLCYAVYIASFILAAMGTINHNLIRGLILAAAALNGFGASILWVAQGRYVSECATEQNMGKFNAIFWAIYMGSYLVGNLFAAFVIVNVNETIFYSIMTGLCVASSLFFLLLKQPVYQAKSIRQTEVISWREVFDQMKEKRMLKFVPLIMTSGICIASNAGIFVPLLTITMSNTLKSEDWSEQVTNQHALVALSVLGLGEIVGSPFYGRVLDRFGHKAIIISCMVGIVVAVTTVIAYVIVFKFYMWAAVAVCFLWGFQEAGLGVFLSCVMGFEFTSKTKPFAVKNFVQSLTVFAVLFIESTLTTQKDFLLYAIFGMGLFGLCAWLVTLLTVKFQKPIDKLTNNYSEALSAEDLNEQ